MDVNKYLFLALLFSYQATVICIECNINNTDFSSLNRVWVSQSDGSEHNFTYKINICSPLNQNGADDPTSCHTGTAICMDLGNGTMLSAGNWSVRVLTENEEHGDAWLISAGDVCPEAPHNNLTTSINFKCGPLIGSPKFLDYEFCVSYFEWESHIFCKGDQPKDVPCYVYDDQRNRYDLSPLAKRKDGYLVSSLMDTDIYINVCRDINPGTLTQGCPAGAGACKKSKGSAIPLGSPTQELKIGNDKSLMLLYTTPQNAPTPPECTTPPSTTITFVCPKQGGSKDPLIINDFDCQYVIQWETEYACPETTLSNKSCTLTKSSADIDIDLRPLTKPTGENYPVNYTDSSGTQYTFFIKVCEELSIPCPGPKYESFVGACQTKMSNGSFGQILGRNNQEELRYADNHLTLTYKGGNKCNHNNFQRMTEIEFICKQDAVDSGRGSPVFKHEEDCRYFFEWETKYACLDHPVNEECRVNNAGNRYDLSSLTRTHDGNWLGLHDNNDEYGTGQYLINVCHNILQGQDSNGCDPGAAICYREISKTRNLGRYEQNPVFNKDSKTIQIQYVNGDFCGGNKHTTTSTINFICKPGVTQSAPVLTHVSYDKCFYDFEWHTAAACVLGEYSGTDCKVQDSDAGFRFDLTPLKKADGSYYTVPDGKSHDFLMNVCGPVTGTKCDNLAGLTGIGICQVPSNGADGAPYSAGNWTSKLTYFDGMINLTYTDGSLYHNDAQTPRKSEITFLCDPEAGVGTPKYLAEIASDHYYGFEWRTSYACPTQPMECTASDLATGQEYDLSQLSLGSNKDNWMLAIPGEKKKFHLNVCRSLNRVHVAGGCNTFASACTTKITDNGEEVIDVADYGHIKSELKVESSGRLKLTYEGQKCNSTSNYITTINFICSKDLVVSSPDEPIKDGPCSYSIIWNTASACPLSSPSPAEECTIKNNVTNYVYNLQPLRKQDGQAYSVKVGDVVYKLNICGNLSTSICGDATHPVAACQVKSDGTKENLVDDKYILEFNGDGRLSLTYEGVRLNGGDRVRVQIDFVCMPGTVDGEPEFMRFERDTYMFIFYTSLACRPMAVDCLVQDETGNQYNLGSLSKDDAWTVLDTRDSDTKYYINVCKPVNNMDGCPDEPIGGCQYASNGHYHNLGYIQSKPIARNGGSITLTYRNGDICHKGTDKESHRSTRINFYCSVTEEGPVFETETDLCEYVFTWRTPAACKLQSSEGQNCKAVDPVYNHQFDVTKLRKNGSDYHVVFGDFDYIINVCGPLQEKHESCDPSLGVGACMTKPTGDAQLAPMSIGKGNSVLEYSAGELSLVYKEGQNGCQTVIKFVCDYSKYGTDGPTFIENTTSCEYIFEWVTMAACTPFKVGSCYVTAKNGDNYDLTSLTMYGDNYEVTEEKDKKKFLINVCFSLVHKANATCPYNAAACMVDLSKPETDAKKYTNLGEVSSQQVRIENGHVELVYTHGEPCQGGFTETHIEFLCDQNAKETSPMDHTMEGSCTHHFVWVNAAGCPIKKQTPDSGGQAGALTCQTTNPATGTVYDLSSLKIPAGSESWSVNDTKSHMFEFNICGPLTGSKCANASKSIGVCQSDSQNQKQIFNAGNSLNDVHFEDVGIVILNYTGGDRCHHGQYQRNTILTFVCNNHNGLGRPVFLDEMSDCTYYISWHTDLVCENEVKCTVTTNDFHTIDLSPLARHPDNIVHSAAGGELYYLSVCSTLTPVSGVMCPPGAGACLTTTESGKMHLSLGRPKSAPTYDEETGKVTLVYVNGSQCDVDSTQNFTTKIVFSCLPGPVRQNPVFVNKAMCQYVFEWPTSVVCYDKEPEKPTDECGFHSYQSGMYFNFTSLSKSDDYIVKNSNTTYYINPCKAVSKSGCASGMVCREMGSSLVSFGAPKQYSFERQDEKSIVMSYASGGTCPDGTIASSEILFRCDREAGLGQPEYFTGIHCQIQFIWKTNLVCPQLKMPCTLVNNGHLFDLTPLSKDIGAWNVSDSNGNSYWINICSGLKKDSLREKCGRDAAACRKSSHGFEIIGSVTDQTPLYKDSETGAIVLEYGQGGNVCSHNKRRADSKPAKTRINFVCGNTYGGPVFNESPANKEECIFEFTWKTQIACEVERQEVSAINGTIFDKHSGGTINLQPLLNTKSTYQEKLHNGDVNSYEVLLDGSSDQCVDGVVCLIRANNRRRVLGTYSSRKFYIDDESLEAVYTTSQKCPNTPSNMTVTSIIQFHCNVKVNGTGSPVLISKSKDCVYIFSWDTPRACLTAQVIQPIVTPNANNGGGDSSGSGSGSSPSSKGGNKSKTVATVVGVFLVAISLCVLVVVFHKHERREACIGGLRRLIGRKSSEYTQLPTAATDDFPVEDEIDGIVTVTDPAERETNREEEPFVHVSPKTYHDDSDEDMLL